MPITKPTSLPRWGEVAGSQGVVGPNEVEPSAGKKDIGWVPGEEPPAGFWNWLLRLTYDWIQYLDAAIFAGPMAAYSSGAGQVIAAGATSIINFATLETDSNAAVTVGAGWHFTVPAGNGGDYTVAASIGQNSAQAGTVALDVFKNGVIAKVLGQSPSQVVSQTITGTVTLRLAAGDTIDIRVLNNGAGTLTLAPSVLTVWVSIKRVN